MNKVKKKIEIPDETLFLTYFGRLPEINVCSRKIVNNKIAVMIGCGKGKSSYRASIRHHGQHTTTFTVEKRRAIIAGMIFAFGI